MSRINPGLFSSDSVEWRTPPDLFRLASDMYGPFRLDAAASDRNALCRRYFTERDDGLSKRWRGRVWCNPPYGRVIGEWVRHAREQASRGGCSVTMLIPSRTDTRYWHDHVMRAEAVHLIRGRVRFSNRGPAPFPSALVHFSGRGDGPPRFESLEAPS